MKLGSYLAALVLLVAPASPSLAGEVVRAFFTSGPQGTEREPIDTVQTASTNRPGVYFFTEIQGMRGERVIHRWEHAGNVQFEVPFRVRSDRWSAYSYKKLDPSLSGRWTVTVLDDHGQVLASESLDFEAAAPAPTPLPERAPAPDPEEPIPVDSLPREAAMPEPEPPVAEPEPSMAEPEPSMAEPEPPMAEPEPAMAEPEPPMAEPEPAMAEPEPSMTEPEPPMAEPEPSMAEPEPSVTEPEPEAERPAEARPTPTIPPPGVRRPRLGARDDPDRTWKDR